MKKLLPTNLHSAGFTLIELMVAIAIVAILSTVGLVVFSNAQSGARDSKRTSDLDAIAKALESKKTSGGVTYSWVASSDFAGNAIPNDPKGVTSYCFAVSTAVPPAAPPTAPAVWAAGCPNGWNDVNGGGAAAAFGANTSSWTVCGMTEQGVKVICKYSNQ
ncbi:MAG: type II secretion system protein [Candidatus Daviesbacteria bacterium]|nr:type II secretion system protein [Candidatus Daviesbacteria bacterium]